MSDIAENEFVTREQSFEIRDTLQEQKDCIDAGEDPLGDETYAFFSYSGGDIEVSCTSDAGILTIVRDGFTDEEFSQLEREAKSAAASVGTMELDTRRSDSVSFKIRY